MAFGLGVLGLAPSEFWTMTPREIAAAADVRLPAGPKPLVRNELDALMSRFPDASQPMRNHDGNR